MNIKLSLFSIALLLFSACSSQPLKPSDPDHVLRIGQLQAYGLELPGNHKDYERFERSKWLDDTVMLEYDFEAPDDLGLPLLSSTIEKHPSATDACTSVTAGDIGLKLSGADVVMHNELFSYGDKSRFAILQVDGNPIGNYFSMCQGNILFDFILGGFYFDNPELLKELLMPLLDASRNFK